MNKHLMKVSVSIVVSSIVAAMLLTACGGDTTTRPTPTAIAPTVSPTPTGPKVDPAVLRARGEEIFQKTAGGVGCKACHGADGKGGNLGPDVRGKTADDINRALGGDAMSFLRISEDDIQAVAAYLKTLQ